MEKNQNYINSRWRRHDILKIAFWLHFSPMLSNNTKFGGKKQNHRQTQVTWPIYM